MPWIVFLSGVSADIMPFCTREYAKHLHFDGTHCPDYCTSTGSTCTWEPAVNATCTRAKSTTIFHGCSTDLGWHAEYDALPDKRVPNHDLVHPCYDSTNPDWTSESSMLSTDTNAQRQCKTMCDRVDQCVGFPGWRRGSSEVDFLDSLKFSSFKIYKFSCNSNRSAEVGVRFSVHGTVQQRAGMRAG